MYLRKFTNVHVQISQIHALVITHLYASLYRSYHATLTKHDYPLMIIINTWNEKSSWVRSAQPNSIKQNKTVKIIKSKFTLKIER